MAFSATYAGRLTSRLAPGALTTAALAYSTERWTARTSSNVVATVVQQQRFGSAVSSLRTRTFATSSSSSTETSAAKTAASAAATPPPAAVASAAAPKKPFSFVEWYEGNLERRPIPTKMVTGSILWSLGDAVAQIVPPAAAGTLDMNTFKYDWVRTGRAFTFGFILHAPTSHLHFNFLEWMTVKTGVKGLAIPVFKAFMEQFVYWSWISNSMYHAAMGYMQGQNTTQVVQRINDVLWETQKAQWVFWIPVQLLNFQFVPVRHQLNVVLITSVVWTALLSAWYPPQEVKEDAPPKVKEEAQKMANLKKRMSMITQQSGGGPAETK